MKKLFLLTAVLAILFSAIINAQTIVPAGDVSGTWTKSGSPYNVTGDIRIPDDLILNIEPGVQVRFQGHYRFIIEGTIRAIGTADEKIVFTVANHTGFTFDYTSTTGSWAGMEFSNNGSVNMNDNDTSVLDYCRFEYSKAADDILSRGTWGGALLVDNFNRLIVRDCQFNNNAAQYGGAIGLNGARFDIIGCQFTNNWALVGGAIMGQGTNISILNNEIMYNTASSGGAIGCWGGSDFVVAENIISYNSAQDGAGIYINASTLNAFNNYITNNTASTRGGGIYSNTSYPRLVNNIICNNQLGGVILSSSDALIFNNTICYNSGAGGGISFAHSNAHVVNTIIWGNSLYDLYLLDGISYPNFFNCVADRSRFSGVTFYGAWENVLNVNPAFMNPTGAAGPSYNALLANWRLQETSPCINAGLPDVVEMFLPDHDIYRSPRICNRIIDIGAAETHIGVVNFSGQITSDQVWFADTVKVYGDIQVNDGVTLTINKGTVVQFQGPYSLSITGTIKAIGSKNDMIVFSCLPESIESGWRGIAFSNTGSMNDNDSSVIKYCKIQYAKNDMGGGIRVYDFSKLLIENSLFENNEASYMGGAIYCNHCGPMIRNNTIINNTAVRGGGIASDHAFPDIVGNTIAYNHASEIADGIFFWFSNCRMDGNLISNHEVAIQGWGGNARQFIFTNNVIVQNFIGLALSDNPLYLINNTICNNEFNITYRDGQLFVLNTILRNGSTEITGEQTRSVFINCNIEGGIDAIDYGSLIPIEFEAIIDTDPGFFRKTELKGPEFETFPADWELLSVSSCINKGTNEVEIFGLPDYDFMNNPRINKDIVDIGAIENQDGLPVIQFEPLGGIFCSGDTHELYVSVGDTALYQWYKDGVEIPGAQKDLIPLDSLTFMHEGNYNCVITNAYGSVLSPTILIVVKTPPELLMTSESEWVRHEDFHVLQVNANGTPPMWFQWFKDAMPIPGADKPELRFLSFDYWHEGTYSCRIENLCGTVMTDDITLYVAPEICMVTVDTATGDNLVIWEKKSEISPITLYNVYREGIITGVFDKLAVVPYDSLSVYLDEKANPSIQAYRYIITATDTAGNETDYELCRPHKTIHLLTTTNSETRATQLDWDFYYGFYYGTFIVYRSINGMDFESFYQMAATSTTFTDPNIYKELLYYRIGVKKPEPCVPTSKLKAGTGPYSQSMSNLEDNRFLTGTNDKQLEGSITIFPNPFNDRTTLRFPNPENQLFRLKVMDLSGKILRDVINISGSEYIFERNDLEKGYYIIELTGDKMYRERIIVE